MTIQNTTLFKCRRSNQRFVLLTPLHMNTARLHVSATVVVTVTTTAATTVTVTVTVTMSLSVSLFSKPGATRHSNAFWAQPLHVANKNIPGPFSLLGTPLRISEFTVLTCHTLQKFRQGENFATFLNGEIFPAKISPPKIPPPPVNNGKEAQPLLNTTANPCSISGAVVMVFCLCTSIQKRGTHLFATELAGGEIIFILDCCCGLWPEEKWIPGSGSEPDQEFSENVRLGVTTGVGPETSVASI